MTRSFSYTTQGHHYVFAWQPGREAELMRRFAAMAIKPEWQFGWIDAAACCKKVRDSQRKEVTR